MINFGATAKGLAKNPIGIVALFLVLIYGFAALLLGTSATTLTEAQRWPLVWFLVLFPLMLLGAFVYLVVFHHEKLYSPSEYRDERHFFRKLAPNEQKARLEEEVKQLEETGAQAGVSPDEQFRPLSREEVRLNVSLAEDLAIRALEQELGVSVSREVAVRAGDGWINLDGAVARGDELVAIEVKHVTGGRLAIFQIEHLLDLLSKLPFERFRRVSLMILIVSEDSEEEDQRLEQQLLQAIEPFEVPAQLRFLKLGNLKDQFGLVLTCAI